jgi:cystathionine gamma-synthase
MLSLRTGGGAARALAVIKKLRVWMPATSLGGVESLIEHRASVEGPNSPTPDDLLRLSVGLEHEDDLFEDLAGALR